MREIKFRAWDLHNNIMMDVVKTDFRDDDSPYGVGWFVNPNCGVRFPKKTRLIVMQFIELKDILRKEVFEGDIYEWQKNKDESEIGEIVYQNGCFKCRSKDDLFYVESMIRNLKIIGNIYENPELLK